jgi:hypothetical protein
MRRRSTGQSLVEMALMLPLLLLIIFGIVDLGYYVYSYSTIYQAARNGTEKASNLGPYKIPAANDDCMQAIKDETAKGAVLFTDITNYMTVSYPSGQRALGEPVQVQINYEIEPLTPLFRYVAFGTQGKMQVRIAARRSVENMGFGPPSDEHPNGLVCTGRDS